MNNSVAGIESRLEIIFLLKFVDTFLLYNIAAEKPAIILISNL